jgi:hypothetical protein
MTAKEHNNLLGIFMLVQGGLVLFTGIILTVVYGGIGGVMLSSAHKQEEQMMGGIFMVIGICVGLIVMAMSILFFVTGVKMRKIAPVGRTLGIVVSILSLFSFPLGTALGVYGLWFLFGDLGKGLYLGGETYAGFPNNQAPPPNSWQ